MGYVAEVISLDEVRASQQRQALRQRLHERFDQWLDEVETQLPEPHPTLAQVSETIWTLRQALTAGVAQTIVEQTHQAQREQSSQRCASCERLLTARPAVARTARTLVGDVEIGSESSVWYGSVVRGDVYFWGSLMGACLIASLPVAVLYNFFVSRFITGFTVGAIK